MRIQRLKIKNFVSIVEADIDFSSFKDGVFIVSGPTGSGKSSIFDAIHFALYGTPSNHNRGAVRKTLFSTYANEKDWLDVQLEFTQGDKHYKLIRSMNSAGNTAAKFYLPDGKILTKLKEIDDAVIAAIRLNGHQFDQMVMLEQNNFSKFLLADSAERGTLLRSVFETDIFLHIQTYLKTKATDLKKEMDELLVAERLILAGRTRDQIQTEYDGADSKVEALKAECETLAKSVQSYQDQYTKRVEYELALVNYTNAQEKLKELYKKTKQVEQLRSQKEQSALFGGIAALYQEHESKQETKNVYEINLASTLSRLGDLPVVDATSCKNDITLCTNKIAALTAERPKAIRAAELKTKIKEQAEILEQPLEPAEQALRESEDLVIDAKAAVDYGSSLRLWDSYQKELSDLRTSLPELDAQLESARAETVLAAKSLLLHECEGDVCPICGQAFNKSAEQDSMPTDCDLSAVGRYEVMVEKARQRIAQLEDLSEPVQPDYLTDVFKAKFYGDERQMTDAVLAKQIALRNTNFEQLAVMKAARETAKTQQAAYTAELDALVEEDPIFLVSTAVLEIDEMLAECRYKQAQAQKELDAYEAVAKQRHVLELQVDSIRSEIAKMDAVLQQIEADPEWELLKDYLIVADSINDYKANEAENLQIITSYDNQVTMYESVQPPVLEIETPAIQLKQLISAQTEELNEVNRLIATHSGRQQLLRDALDKLKELEDERTRLHKDLDKYDALAKIVCGDNGSKISLENFVLHRQLEWILQNSNNFLAQLTNNQYQLQLSWQSISGRKQGGLDLNVLDVNTGAVRPSQTFSGGELFLLSLSLSIGLMVSINAVYSAVSLETIYIDEGFGTLDSAVLNRVLALVHSLQSVSSIGIISHVQELIEAIPQGLRVDKTLTGTKIQKF